MTSHPRADGSVSILGLGTAIPQHGGDLDTALQIAKRLSTNGPEQQRVVEVLYRRTKIKNRGSVLLDEAMGDGAVHDFYPPPRSTDDLGPTTAERSRRYAAEASQLALTAAATALTDSGIRADQVTDLVTVSCTGFTSPGVDIDLIDGLGLSTNTKRVQVGFMGCHGSINGMRAAQGIAMISPSTHVLVVSVELCSLHYQYGFDPDRIVSGALFADGAAALVMGPSFDTDHPQLVATGSKWIPDSRDAMTWKIGDHGFEMTLSSTVPDLIRAHLPTVVDDFLIQQGETRSSVGGWAVHPGGPRILDVVEQSLSLPPKDLEASRWILQNHGNMSSATMLFLLKSFQETGQRRPWLMLGFGPGLEIEMALIR